MEEYLTRLTQNRQNLLREIDHLNTEEVNLTPLGNPNNIIWNLGHLLIVGENLLYKHSNVDRPSHSFDLSKFARNTKPSEPISLEESLLIKSDLLKTSSAFIEIHGIGRTDETSAGIGKLISEEELQFLLFHEQLHYKSIFRLMNAITGEKTIAEAVLIV